jgi:hypothetical protein
MNPWLRHSALVLSFAAVSCFAVAQRGEGSSQSRNEDETDTRLPNGKVQRDEILKAEHEQNLKDAARLADLAEQLKQELEKNDRYVISVSSLKKIDEIEKLVKKIRSRLRRN